MVKEVSLSKPWYEYTEAELNQHMAEHSTSGKKYGYCGYDLEFSYLLGHPTRDFQTICRNRIIKALQGKGLKLPEQLGRTEHLQNNYFDEMPVGVHDLAYQAQNLVYMYALGLVETLDKTFLQDIRDTTVRNAYRKEGSTLDGILPIFHEAIGMKPEIDIDEAKDARGYYLSKRPIADEITRLGRTFKLRFRDLNLTRLHELDGSRLGELI